MISPALRPQVISLWLSHRDYHDAIISGLESGDIRFNELNLDLEQRRTLRRWSRPDIQRRAKVLFGDEEYTNRKAVVETWLAAMPGEGFAKEGAIIFQQRCAVCHRSGRLGNDLGPDLTGVSHRSVEDLLSHILDPNMVIDPNYVTCSVVTHGGDVFVGLLVRSGRESVTLALGDATEKTVPRVEMKVFEALKTSLMPEGLEAGLSKADMRDLIAFLQEGR
jgi:putative heme-binding domain-containing protein